MGSTTEEFKFTIDLSNIGVGMDYAVSSTNASNPTSITGVTANTYSLTNVKLKSGQTIKISGLPSDVLYKMIIQFVSYGIGEMAQKENKELKDTVGNWTEKYWEHFPPQIRTKIKSFINGEITSGEFQKNIKELIS